MSVSFASMSARNVIRNGGGYQFSLLENVARRNDSR
jgi:hypothetical protein